MSTFFSSTVVHGKQLGRTIGFPTANLLVDSESVLPAKGVYAARARVLETDYLAMVYIGNKPTVDNSGDKVIEVNLLDFEGDIYGQMMQVEIVEFIRGEQRFDSIDLLREQIYRDKENIIKVLTK